MKPVVKSLREGQKVWATIEEVIFEEVLIVNFQGDLLRVENKSGRHFRPGQRIQLNVTSIQPLNFKLMEAKRQNPPAGRINYSV